MRSAIGMLGVGLLFVGLHGVAEAEPAAKYIGETEKNLKNFHGVAEAAASPRAIIEMATGKIGDRQDPSKIVVELYEKDAPKTVANFVKLAKQGFYNGLSFWRVVPGFVVQGGDPKGDGTGGPGYTIRDEVNARKHLTGTVAMAKTAAPHSAGSQFYITLAPQPALDNRYTVFGQVVEGMAVVMKIKRGDIMKKVTIIEATR